MKLPDFRSRDGFARTGSIEVNGRRLRLPGIIDPADEFPGIFTSPPQNIPLSAKAGYAAGKDPACTGSPAIIHPADLNAALGDGVLLVPNWHTVLDDPHRFVRTLYRMKSLHPPDVAWYAPACALPSNLYLLSYCGFDLFDWTAVDLCTARQEYCLPEGIFPRETMDEGLCGCEGCRDGDLWMHNRAALTQECAHIIHAIAMQQLRDLVESRSRYFPSQVSVFRLMDQEYSTLETSVPVSRKGVMRFTSGDSLARVEVRRFMERVAQRYIPPRNDVAVLLPCSAKKPYSLSKSHQKFIKAVDRRAHEIILTSPLGLVPRDIELCYPAARYDVPVTGYWDHEERHVISSQIADYFTRHSYRRIILHLEGDALLVARAGLEAAGIRSECTTDKDAPTSTAALERLYAALEGEKKRSSQILRGMCSLQFGSVPDTNGIVMEGRYPLVRFMKKKRPWFGIDPVTGMVRPTLDGWSLITTGYRIFIDSFDPKGDILAPGIIDADPAIREGDEVLVTGEGVEATGRAAMGASEMVRSRRGVAVRVRKVKREGTLS